MKSKPVYAALELDPLARRHLFLTHGPEGRDAARRFAAAHSEAHATALPLDGSDVSVLLDSALAEAGMDTAFYVLGPETFLWETAHRLRRAGVENCRIRQKLAGSAARRVFCVHCRCMNAEVKTTVHRCGGCGLHLNVRDHFSRPLQAYMGVVADAEAPGDVPEPELLSW